jgi:hypothetical protein
MKCYEIADCFAATDDRKPGCNGELSVVNQCDLEPLVF